MTTGKVKRSGDAVVFVLLNVASKAFVYVICAETVIKVQSLSLRETLL